MDSHRPKRELWLYGLIFLLALALRVIRLGAFPLTDAEAVPALQALQIAQDARPVIGPNSTYVLLTSLLFFTGEASNFIARLAPALAGVSLVFVPFFFRRRLPPLAGPLTALFIAVDPGLLALSRQAGSSILAVAALLFAWAYLERGAWIRAGIFAAFAALGGPAVWAGLLGLGLAWAVLQSMERGAPAPEPEEGEPLPTPPPPLSAGWKAALIAFLVTLVLFGTVIFLVPGGLNGAVNGLIEYARGWANLSGVPGRLLFFSLLFYQPLTLILALIAIVRGWLSGNRLVIRLSVWLLVALLLAVFYPAHQVHDVVWALLPLSALAALELSRHFDVQPEERLETAGVALLTIFILAFAWMDFASLPWQAGAAGQSNLRIWLLFGALFLLAVSLLLVAVGWSARTARLGGMWGMVFFLGLISLSAAFAAGRLRAEYTAELWDSGPYPVQVELIANTAAELSEWRFGSADSAPVTFLNNEYPALHWAMRGREVTLVDGLDPASSPALVVTPFMTSVGLAQPYRGQDFTWNQSPNWSTALPGDWLRWMVQRDMTPNYDTIMLWAREDLFLDGPSRFTPDTQP